jgi:ABC-type glycerol-3-phosphate transport system substrate-binding protein
MEEPMTKSIRVRLAVAVAGVALGLLAAGQASAQKIVFWNNWDGSRAPQLRSLLDEFERRNPGVTVESVTLSSDSTTQRMLTAVASGAVPDVYMTSDTPKWASLGALLPLDEYVKKDALDLDRTFFKSGIEGSKFDGKLLQLPFKVPTSLLVWYNKELWKKAGLSEDKLPKTWAELQDAAKRLTVINGAVVSQLGMNICTNCTTAVTENAFIEWLSRNGGAVLTADGKDVAFDGKAGLDTLKWMVEFSTQTSGGWGTAVRQFGTNYKELRPAFYSGKLAMIHDGPYAFNIMATDAPHMLDKVGAFLSPVNASNPDAKQRFLAFGVPGYAIPKGARNPDLSWKLIKFIAAEDAGGCRFFQMQKRADSPLRNCAVDIPGDLAKVFSANAELVESFIAPGTFQQIHVRLQQMQEAALLGKQTPEEALRAAAVDVRRILRQ